MTGCFRTEARTRGAVGQRINRPTAPDESAQRVFGAARALAAKACLRIVLRGHELPKEPRATLEPCWREEARARHEAAWVAAGLSRPGDLSHVPKQQARRREHHGEERVEDENAADPGPTP